MKLTILALALSMVPEVAQACVTAHVYLNNCIFGGDTLSAQVFDNDVEVCNGGKTINLASANSNFCIDGCQPGYSFCVTNNAKTAVYDNGRGYRVTMGPAKTQNTDYTCGSAGSHDIKGTEVETCFFDHFWNCNNFKPCNLCDYRASCPR